MATQTHRCRVCLDSNNSKMLHDLSANFPVYLKTTDSLSKVLEKVTSTLIPISPNLPHEICRVCLKKLKDVCLFIHDFKETQKELGKVELNASDNREEIILKIEEDHYDEADDCEVNSADVQKTPDTVNGKRVKKEVPSDDENALQQELECFDGLKDSIASNLNLSNSNDLDDPSYDQNSSDLSDDGAETIRIITLDESGNSGLSVAKILDGGKKKLNVVTDVEQSLKKFFSEKTSYMCQSCPRTFVTRKGLYQHSRLHTPEYISRLKCKICGHQNKSRSAFLHHKLKHSDIRVACDECDKTVTTKWQLTEHKRRMHGGGLPEKYFCEECGKGFKYSNALKYHIVAVHNTSEKAHQCQFCGFKCATKQHLKRHERCHTGERPYRCKYCEKTFRGTTERLKHEHIHDQIFNSQCKYCPKQFVNRWNMRVHMMQHRGDYECSLCNYSFKDKEILEFHLKYRHQKKAQKVVKEEDLGGNEYFEHYESLDDAVSHLVDYAPFEEEIQ